MIHGKIYLLALALIFVSSNDAFAQDKPKVSAVLKARFKASKKKINRKALRAVVRSGKKNRGKRLVLDKRGPVTLMPLRTMRVKPKARELSKSLQLPPRMREYTQYIDGKTGGKRPPVKASLKSDMTPIKNQRSRGTCVAFASVSALEYAYGDRAFKKGENLSEQDAFYLMKKEEGKGETHCDDGLLTYKAAEYLTKEAISKETYWRYESKRKMGCPVQSDKDVRPKKAERNAQYRIKSSQLIFRKDELSADVGKWINNPGYLESIVAAGYPIVIGVHVAGWTKLRTIIDVKLDESGDPLESDGGHAMVLVGYNRAKQYFIVKNSWGVFRGYGGYLRLSYDYMRTYGKYGYYITEVHPVAAQTGQCRQDVDCAAGTYCTTGIAGLGKGKCKTKKAKGKACLSWRQCTSGRCAGGICRDPHECTKTADCKSRQYCKSGTLGGKNTCKSLKSNGKTCLTKKQCKSGRCAWWKRCAKANECRKDADCKSGAYCSKGLLNVKKHECQKKRKSGAKCTRSKQCRSNKCLVLKRKCR